MVLLPLLVARGNRKQECYKKKIKKRCWELDHWEKSQICSSLGRQSWLVWLCCVFLARNRSMTEQCCIWDRIYSSFLTVLEAPVSLWNSMLACTLVTKSDWLNGAAVAITKAIVKHLGLKFWPSVTAGDSRDLLFGLGQARFIIIKIINIRIESIKIYASK